MNPSVDDIVSALFEKTGDSEEARAMREEISNNCREHFNDLIARGLSPEEAILEIRESLKGMEEVIDEIVRSGRADAAKSAALPVRAGSGLMKAPENAGSAGRNMDFVASSLRRVEFESGSIDLIVEPSPDGAIHLVPDPDDGSIIVSTQVLDGVLRIKAENCEKEEAADNSSFGGVIAGFLKKALSGVPIRIGSAALRLLLPENAPEIGAGTKSGDISLRGIAAPGLDLSSVSGDIDVALQGKTGHCALLTRSGDIRFEGSAATFSAESASGDISLRGEFDSCCSRSRSGDVEADVAGDSLSLYTTSGDIELRGRVNSLEITSTSGDIELSAFFREGAFASTSGDVTLTAHDALLLKRISVNTVSGDALVHLPEGLKASVRFTTVSGDSENTHNGGAAGDATVTLRSVSGDLTVR